jgi:hypothetical protein
MGQSWKRLAFLHWRVDVDALASRLPPGIEPDVFDGSAWIGVTPFVVHSVRTRFTPPLPWLSTFAETNVRTYITRDGKPGIWFLSLDTPRRPAIFGARRAYRLPYHRARIEVHMRNGVVDYRLERAGGQARLAVSYEPVGAGYPATERAFERFACERYCLFTVDEDLALMRADIHHPPWHVQHALVEIRHNTMAQPYGIELEGDPVGHFAARQDVLIWPLEYERSG